MVVRHCPVLRPRTARIREPRTLIPMRASPATSRLKTWVVEAVGTDVAGGHDPIFGEWPRTGAGTGGPPGLDPRHACRYALSPQYPGSPRTVAAAAVCRLRASPLGRPSSSPSPTGLCRKIEA